VRRLLVTVALLAVLVLAVPSAAAQTDSEMTTTSVINEGADIIPEPNSGRAPEDAGDRGGALQTVLFVGIVGGLVVMAVIVARQSRRARAERGF
jgi:beta-lactamase regulating signal transducer with metallopeptidase domain